MSGVRVQCDGTQAFRYRTDAEGIHYSPRLVVPGTLLSLDWLNKQDVPREDYEIIWVELYDRVVPDALEYADAVITCGQRGRYHKHIGYNIGLLEARGDVVTVCDSDAVFPPDFISSIETAFGTGEGATEKSLVLKCITRGGPVRHIPTVCGISPSWASTNGIRFGKMSAPA